MAVMHLNIGASPINTKKKKKKKRKIPEILTPVGCV